VVRVASDGAATLVFGDGVTGRPLPAGADIEAIYRRGGGDAGPRKTSSGVPGAAERGPYVDLDIALLELFAQIGDLLSHYQDQVASEAYLETAHERASVANAADLRRAFRERRDVIRVCPCLRPLR
jgi:hypothetical protein